MKLIRMKADRTGLVLSLPSGPHVVDIVGSLGAFTPHAPIANGILNGALKDGCNWEVIVKHWAYLRSPLQQLARIASSNPDHPLLAIHPLADAIQCEGVRDGIAAIELTDAEVLDPTGWRAMARQFGEPAVSIGATGAEIVDFASYTTQRT